MDATREQQERELVSDKVEALLRAFPPGSVPAPEFLGAQFDAGLAWVHFPEGLGGLGLERGLNQLVQSRLREVGAPFTETTNPLGYHMAAPTLMAWGEPGQQTRHLRAIFTCDKLWCQLFSEPGAGSDLAAVSTRAVRSEGGWILNGQKVWTSMATVSDIGMTLARHDPGLPKHQGLTYFAVDMHAPGVLVRPLRQMTGDAEFNEVYLTDVFVPDSERIGPIGSGWKVATATLMNERVMFGMDQEVPGPVDIALALYRERSIADPEIRQRLVELWIDSRVLALSNSRAARNLAAGTPGPEGSTGKIEVARVNQEGFDLCIEILGNDGLLYEAYAMEEFDVKELSRDPSVDVPRAFLRSRANSIEGGTTEIMKNILAERVLGLPAEQRADRDRPFSDLRTDIRPEGRP